MKFLVAKAADLAAATAVRLPQPASRKLAALPASLVASTRPPAAPAPTLADKRGRQRADRARYHAQCRMVMSF